MLVVPPAALVLRAALAVVAGGVGRFVAGKQSVAELAELRLIVLAVLALVVPPAVLVLALLELAVVEYRLVGCIGLPVALAQELAVARLAALAAVALVA